MADIMSTDGHRGSIESRDESPTRAENPGQRHRMDSSPAGTGMRRDIVVDTSRARTNLPVVRMCLKKLNFTERHDNTSGSSLQSDCVQPPDIFWHAGVYGDMKDTVKSGQVNKFPGMNEITKKVSLTRSINLMQQLFPESFTFYPKSWFLPHQLEDLYAHFYATSESSKNRIPWYIVKPDEGCQGTDIYLIHSPEQLKEPTQPQLVQEYVPNPYLLNNNLKFDLRVYVVIKSLQPLSMYIAKEGMVRFCTVQYRPPSMGNSSRTFMHLTNYAVNKVSGNFQLPTDLRNGSGNKRLLSSVMHQMEARGVDTRVLWKKIKIISVKTVFAMIPEMILHYEREFGDVSFAGPSCFQILGLDVLITDKLEPVLLEVNACPSLTMTIPGVNAEELEPGSDLPVSMVDLAIKYPLVRDTLKLVTDLPLSSGAEKTRVNHQRSGQKSFDDMILDSEDVLSLTEIFPAQFGLTLGPMLFLHRAAYLFMYFVYDPRKCLGVTNAAMKTFLRKCNLQFYIPQSHVDACCDKIRKRWEGYRVQGIPFHGFVEFLMMIAGRKFGVANPASLRQLLHDCEHALRYHGVGVTRLRPDRETLASANEKGRTLMPTEIDLFLLPSDGLSRKRRTILPKINGGTAFAVTNPPQFDKQDSNNGTRIGRRPPPPRFNGRR